MLLPRKHFLTVLLTTSILVAGCKEQNSKSAPDITSDLTSLTVETVDQKTIEKLLDVKTRKISSDDAKAALEKLGLKAGTSSLEWSDEKGSNGKYSYSDLSTKTKNGEAITIKKLEFTGARTEGDTATFDRMDMFDVNIKDEDRTLTLDKITLSRPAPQMASAILEAIDNMDDIRDLSDLDLDIDIEDGELGFGAVMLSGFKATNKDTNINLDYLGWGENESTDKATFLLENMSLAATDPSTGTPVNVSLESISGSGLNMDYFGQLGSTGLGQDMIARAGSLGKSAQAFNPYTKTFDTFALKNFNLDMDTLSVKTDGMTGRATQKGKITTIRQKLDPITIGFSADPKNQDLMQLKTILSELDLEQLAFSSDQTTVMDEGADTFAIENSTVRVHDVFKMDYDYKGSGLKNLQFNKGDDVTQAELQDMVEKLNLTSLNIALTDESFVDKAFTYAAKMQGTSPRLLRMQAKGGLMLASFGAQNEAQGEALTQIAEALGQFMDEGGTIKVSLNPTEPISVAQFQGVDPTSLDPSDFGFSVTHEK